MVQITSFIQSIIVTIIMIAFVIIVITTIIIIMEELIHKDSRLKFKEYNNLEI
jgi:Na+/proline symporter